MPHCEKNCFSLSKKVQHAGLSRRCVEAALDSLTVDNVILMLERSVAAAEARVEDACWRWG